MNSPMTTPSRRVARRILVLGLPLLLAAPRRGVRPPHPAARHVHFTTHEGSFLSFDVSPDRKWIAFDLLGEIWRLPVAGGAARPITSVVRDTADFADPIITSGGRTVLARGEWRGREGFFTISLSDGRTAWIGADSLDWFRNPVTLSPAPSHDGRRMLFARRDRGGRWRCVERTIATDDEREVAITAPVESSCHGPQYSTDEREVYFEVITNQPNTFPSAGRIWRVPVGGGAARPLTPPDIRARAVSIAPDGRRVAYLVMDSLNRAQVWTQGTSDSAGVRLSDEDDVVPTRVRWLGTDTVIYVAGGRLWRRDLLSRRRREIPFSATIDFVRTEPALPQVTFAKAGETVALRGAVNAALSPDGGAIATIAANRLWVGPATPGAVARAIATVPTGAAGVQWSPDGSRIVWWAGEVGEEDAFATDTATGAASRLTSLRGTERSPQWSPDGRYFTFLHVARDSGKPVVLRQLVVTAPGSTIRSASDARDFGPGGGFHWGPRSDALLQLGPDNNARSRSATLHFLDGAPARPVRGLPGGVSSVRWLPGDTLAFVAAGRLMHARFDVSAGLVGPASPISDEPALLLTSARNGDLLYVSEDGLRVRRGGASPVRIGWPVHATVRSAPPPLLIRNVRIIDGTGSAATTPRDVFIREGRIARISPSGRTRVAPGTQVLEAAGRTAVPGLIDLHSHASTPAQLRAKLFYGVTTDRHLDAPGNSYEDVNAGLFFGPRQAGSHLRIYTDWAFDLGSITEADDRHLDRVLRAGLRSLGSTLLKVYSNSRWAPQVRAVAGAHAMGVRATGHCAYPLALVASGIESKEHVGRQCTLRDAGVWYDDLIQLYANARVPVVVTLSLFRGFDRFRSAPLLLPPEVAGLFRTPERTRIEGELSGDPIPPAFTSAFANAFRATRDLHRAGAIVGAGTDYDRPDALQYELEALVEASFTPLEAIAAATSVAARIMGADDEIGRIAPTFLADIVILDGDPTQDIRNVRRIWAVIQGGREVDRRALVASGWDNVILPP
jgi:dipeptidyl aminopeptidase/acylaminoacyl peptidase